MVPDIADILERMYAGSGTARGDKRKGDMEPDEFVPEDGDLNRGVVFHMCNGWHHRTQKALEGRTEEKQTSAGMIATVGWPIEATSQGWNYLDYPVTGEGASHRMEVENWVPTEYKKALIEGGGGKDGWGGFSGTGMWRIECDGNRGARGARIVLVGVVFAELHDEEGNYDRPVALRTHSKTDILRGLETAEEQGIYSSEMWGE